MTRRIERMDDTANEPSGAESATATREGELRNERLRIVAAAILGMVVKGLDFERRDLVRLGYADRGVYRAFGSLRKARVIKKVTRKNYAFRDKVLAEVRKLAAEDIGRPVGWPSIHNFLFVAYGMFDWDEKRMDAFLSFLKKDWLHRMRGSGRPLERSRGRTEGVQGEEEKTYTMREAAERLGVAVRTIREWDRRGGKIRCIRLPSGRVRVPEGEVTRLLAEVQD